jgi:hypothetical protein
VTVAELYVLFGLQPDKGSWKEGMGLLKSLRNAAQQLVGIEAVKSLVGFVEHAAEAGTHIIGTATALGVSTQAFQEWSYVAKRAGTDANQFATGVGMFERNLLEFSRGGGSKRFKAAMDLVGISTSEAATILTKPDGVNDALFKVADAYKRGGINAKDAAINTSLFGARARGMAADLSQGSGPLKEQIQHLHEIGGVIGDDQLKNLKQLNNGIVDMKTAFSGLALQTIGTLAPALTDMANAAAKWIAENRDIISGALEAAVTAVAYAFQAVGAVVSALGDIIRAAMGGDEGATAILIGLAVAIATFVLPALGSMALAVIAATWPFLAIAAVAAGIAYGILQIIKHWDTVKRVAGAAVDWVKSKWDDFWAEVEGTAQLFVDGWHEFMDAAGKAFDYVTSLDWAKAIPVLGPLGELLGHGTASLLGGKAGGQDLTSDDMGGAVKQVMPDGSVVWHDPSDSAAPVGASPRGNMGQGVVVQGGTTNLTINVKDVDQARQAKDKFDEEQQKQNRAAAAVFGGAE